MVTATPNTLGTVFDQIWAAVQNEAEKHRNELDDIFNKVGELGRDVAALPGDAWQALKDLTDPPQWWSLLLFLMTRIAELDEQRLTAGAAQPDGWSRMVTLTYKPLPGDPVPDTSRFTLGLALIKDKDAGGTDLSRGVYIRTVGPVDWSPVKVPGNVFSISVKASDGENVWKIPFGQSVAGPGLGDATVDLVLSGWDPPDIGDKTWASLSTAPPQLGLHLNSAAGKPLWAFTIGVGEPKGPGVRAFVDPAKKLGLLGEILSIAKIDERYSPQYRRDQIGGGAFDLNHTSAS